jgi:integration host factor subunit beta
MTKSDLIDRLCESEKLPKGRAELLVHIIFESMEAALRRGERIEIRGFGSFEIRHYRAYEGRNPRSGVTVSVRPKRLPFFKVGKELKERVDAGARAAAARAGVKRAAAAPAARAEGARSDGTPVTAPMASTGPVPADAEPGSSESTPSGVSRASA